MLVGDIEEDREVYGLAVQMNRDDRFRPRGYFLRDLRRIQIKKALLKIAK